VNCNTKPYLEVAKVTKRLAVSQQMHTFHNKRLNFKKLKKVEGKEGYCIELSNRLAALKNLNADVDINRAQEAIRENTKISATERKCYYDLKKHKP
jgi:hypothetical protein